MSSILDALNKAEEERAAQEDAFARGFDDLDVEDQLTGRTQGNGSRKQGISLTPFKVLILGVVFLGGIAAVSGGAAVAVLYLRDGRPPVEMRDAAANPEQSLASVSPTVPGPQSQTHVRPAIPSLEPPERTSEPAETTPAAEMTSPEPVLPDAEATQPSAERLPGESSQPETPEWTPAPPEPAEASTGSNTSAGAPPAPESTVPAEPPSSMKSVAPESPVPAPRVQLAAAENVQTHRPAPTPEPKPAAPLPKPSPASSEPAGSSTPAPVKIEAPTTSTTAGAMVPSSSSQASAAATQLVAPDEVDIMSLPELTESDRRRLKLPEITVNVVGRPSKYRPQPSAMINFNRVVLNDFIPGTKAQLIGVSVHGVGIQVNSERYFVPK